MTTPKILPARCSAGGNFARRQALGAVFRSAPPAVSGGIFRITAPAGRPATYLS